MNEFLSKYCSPEWCEFVTFHSEKIKYKAGDIIFKTGDVTKGIYIIQDGKVKITTHSGHNNERIIRLVTKSDILGHRGFGGNWTYSISAIALEDAELMFIPLKVFNQTVRANPEFGFYMMMFFAEELRESERLASQLPVRNLVASVLFNNFKVFGLETGSETKLSFTLSRKDIANQAGTRYETVVRVLADLNKENIIKTEGKAIHILDITKLEQIKKGEE
ncbi:MAG: Crp/Fnr family transcriptional regulator [Flavobacteriia bacterium]|nr:Crp/Fnr family transcriptional regulator [Flavobacteriia bacterium]